MLGLFVRLTGLLLLVHILTARSAEAQPCYTCRAEKCPVDKTMPEWCGKKGADPLQRAQKPKAAPASMTGLSIVSEPPGAGVRRDSAEGELLGETPLTGLTFSPGRHRFVLQRDGYEAGLLVVEVRQLNEQFSLILKKQPSTEPLVVPAPPIPEPLEPQVSETPTAPPAVQVAPPVQTALPRKPKRWSKGRLIAIGTLGGLFAISLATSITLTALDGKLAPDPCPAGYPDCSYSLSLAYGVGYGISGILAGGLLLALTLPSKKPVK